MKYFFSILIIGFSILIAKNDPNPLRFKDSLHIDNVKINNFIDYDEKNSFPLDPIVFVGSSSIRMWKTADYFTGFPIINRGFGGSHLSDVNFFINETVIKYKPRIIVLYAGDNDIAAGKTPMKVFNDFLIVSFIKPDILALIQSWISGFIISRIFFFIVISL